MTIRKEHFRARCALRGQNHERLCSVHGNKVKIGVDEAPTHVSVIYENVSVADHDDFPDGDFELTFNGQTVQLIRESGVYLASG